MLPRKISAYPPPKLHRQITPLRHALLPPTHTFRAQSLNHKMAHCDPSRLHFRKIVRHPRLWPHAQSPSFPSGRIAPNSRRLALCRIFQTTNLISLFSAHAPTLVAVQVVRPPPPQHRFTRKHLLVHLAKSRTQRPLPIPLKLSLSRLLLRMRLQTFAILPRNLHLDPPWK
jgi:hypothetical protein